MTTYYFCNWVNKRLLPNSILEGGFPRKNALETSRKWLWAQWKQFTKAHCNYSIGSLKNNIPLIYESVTIENIQNHFCKVRHYMFAYLEGFTLGIELEMHIKK